MHRSHRILSALPALGAAVVSGSALAQGAQPAIGGAAGSAVRASSAAAAVR
jgi:hypothetical protein